MDQVSTRSSSPGENSADPITKLAKPVSAWLLQILAAVGSVMYTVGAGRLTLFLLQNQSRLDQLAFHILWRLLAVALGIAAVTAIQRRSVYARASGLAYLALLLAIVIDATSLDMQAVGPTFLGQLLANAAMLGLIGYWSYAFGFSKTARNYFGFGG